MKYEILRYRNTTKQFYEKPGMNWHRPVVISKHEAVSQLLQEYTSHNGNGVRILVFEHIAGHVNFQDMWATFRILYALLARVRIAFQTASEASIIIDNAQHYKNDVVTEVIPFLA